MASTTRKKPCVKCTKGGGITTCDGCQQSFCIKHIVEHRQELGTQMDEIGQEHDLLQRDLTQDHSTHAFQARIDMWEQESITKIQVAAEAARVDLRQSIDRTKQDLKMSVDKITEELRSSRESEDYTEIDLKKWIEQLKELRERLEAPLNIDIMDDDKVVPPIHIIKVSDQNHSTSQVEALPVQEQFGNISGKVILSEEGSLATCLGAYWDGSNVFGINLYSSNIHHIRFRIEKKGSNNIFFGINSASRDMTSSISTSVHIYGWWEFEYSVVNDTKSIRTGDDVTLTLDCNNRQIQFEHHRTNKIDRLAVELEKCALPWRILVTLRSVGDSVRILTANLC